MPVPVINFYPRSRQVKPHIDDQGEVHLCITDWPQYLRQRDRTKKDGQSGDWRVYRPSVDALLQQQQD